MSLFRYLWACLKTGLISFGGNFSLVSVFKAEIDKYCQSEDVDLTSLIALTSFLPGPMAANTVVLVGYKFHGIVGALLGLIALLIPSFLFVTLLADVFSKLSAWMYWPAVSNGLYMGISVVIINVGINFWQKGTGTKEYDYLVLLGLLLVGVTTFFFNAFVSVLVLAIFGIRGLMKKFNPLGNFEKDSSSKFSYLAIVVLLVVIGLSWFLEDLMWVYTVLGLTLFGGGYVFIHLAEGLLVDTLGLLSYQEYFDGIALGQVTPGPIMISVAVFGYKLNGLVGATLATLAFFVPTALVSIVILNVVGKIKTHFERFVRGCHPAITGMILFAGLNITFRTMSDLKEVDLLVCVLNLGITFWLTRKFKLLPLLTILLSVAISAVSVGL